MADDADPIAFLEHEVDVAERMDDESRARMADRGFQIHDYGNFEKDSTFRTYDNRPRSALVCRSQSNTP